jgi:DUF1365 family protein
MHHRFVPKEHKFNYRIFLVALDLDEIELCNKELFFFSVNRWNIYSIKDADYLPTFEKVHNPTKTNAHELKQDSSKSLKERVINYLAHNNINCEGGKIVLVTVPRIFGYAFNPVSFYYCYDKSGTSVAAIVEVTNTFREMKLYLVNKTNEGNKPRFSARMAKNFYVSPFSKVDLSFDFDLYEPSHVFAVCIDDYNEKTRVLESTMAGPKRIIADSRLLAWLLKYPLLTIRIISLIHIHALKLYLKKIPWFKKTANADLQKDLFKPHHSLN